MTQDTKAPGIIKAVRKGENFPEKIHAHSAVVRFPSGVESGNWQSQPDVETKEYARLDLLTAAEAERDKAVKMKNLLTGDKIMLRSELAGMTAERDRLAALLEEAKTCLQRITWALDEENGAMEAQALSYVRATLAAIQEDKTCD